MITKLIQRHSRLTLILSVAFVVSYTHQLAAQYNDGGHCGCEEMKVNNFSAEIIIVSASSADSFSFGSSSDHPDSPTQSIPTTSCQHSHCSPPAATLISSISQLDAVLSCAHLVQATLSVPAPLSDGIDHPPS